MNKYIDIHVYFFYYLYAIHRRIKNTKLVKPNSLFHPRRIIMGISFEYILFE